MNIEVDAESLNKLRAISELSKCSLDIVCSVLLAAEVLRRKA